MKKVLALVLAFAMMFSTITVAFAEPEVSAEAKALATVGMLAGDGNGVTAEYTAKEMTRFTAAISLLKLKGLYNDALAFKGDANFADVDAVKWEEGKNILAYLKANPGLGFGGNEKGEFNPNGNINEQSYYKVLLETLGYKQTTAEVAGDFAWAEVLEFAEKVGLKPAKAEKFTVDELAKATVGALKAKMKDGKVLINVLVEAGKVDKEKALAANLMEEASTTTDAKLASVIATANDKVEVTFDADVAQAFAENVGNYSIVTKGSKTALEVKEAKAVGTTIVELTTAPQTGGTAYTMQVGDTLKNFAGLAKIAGAPEVDKVTCIDTETVEVVFKKAMDRTSVEDVANYTLNNGATVKAAELWIDQDDSRMTVKLTTEGVANNKVYKLTIANVKSADLVALKSVTKSFAGIADTKAPTIKGNVVVKNNQRIQITFDDKHGLDKASAEDPANWAIEGLAINKITALDVDGDDYGYLEVVEIDTEPMTPSHKYTVTISNLADGSSQKNVIAKALTKTFYGVAIDKTAPKAGSISVLGDNMVEVVFTETNRLDADTATDVNNYTFTEGLQVLEAKLIRANKPDTALGKTVVLTTSTMDTATTYKLTIENVADEFGNVMTKVSNRALARSKGPDIKAPSVEKVEWVDKNTVKVYFDERLDVDSANDPANYSINGNIGVVKKAALSAASGYTRVDLTTPDLANNKAYKVTINGVKDRLGNEMANYVAGFTSGMKSADTERPKIENIVAINEDEVRITFNEPVTATPAAVNMTLSYGSGTVTRNAAIVGVSSSNYTIEDNTTVVFKVAGKINTNDEITVDTLTGIKDLHNNSFAIDPQDKPTFYGNTDENDAPEVVAIDQVNVKKLQVTFSEPVIAPSTITSNGITFTAKVDADDDETTEALSVVTLTTTSLIPYEKAFTFNFSGITDYVAKASADTAYEYTAYLDDEDNPVIDYVEAVSTTKIEVHFNESIDRPGTYIIKDSDGKTVSLSGLNAVVDSSDDTIVNVTFSNPSNSWKIKPGDVYTLVPKTAARDIKGNPVENLSDLAFDFVASAVVNFDYVKGVKIIDAKTIDVTFTRAMDTTSGDTLVVKADVAGAGNMVNTALNIANANPKLATVAGIKGNGTTTLTVNLNTPLLEDVNYVVTSNIGTRKFSGVLGDGGLEVTKSGTDYFVTFSGWADDSYVVTVVYEGVSLGDVVNANKTAEQGYNINGLIDTEVSVDSLYTVEVRRTNDSAVLYSKEFTKE